MRKRESDKKKRSIRNIVWGIVLVVLFVLLFLLGSMIIEYNSTGKGSEETVTIEIEQGEGVWDIAEKLAEKDLITYRVVFCLKAKMMNANLRYGKFELHKDAGLENLIEDLTKGGAKKEEKQFTIPEGYSIEQIAVKLEKEGFCSSEEFLQAVEQDYDYWFLEEVPNDSDIKYRLQGYLFPETYAIAENMTAEDIVKVMLSQFDKEFTEEMKQQAEDMGKSVFEVVTEASIIERETMIDSERETVAGVIKNRLEKGMRLEMCPTVLYPLTNGIYDKTTVSYEDTQYDSPYNTYENEGLPPGPIACPGRLSLKAALNPEEHNYLFYHTDKSKNDGSHVFTETYQEHTSTQ